MKQRGRTSEAALSVVPLTAKRVEPPPDLSKEEMSAFRALVATVAPEHFTKTDVPLIVAYVQATQISRRAAIALDDDFVSRDTLALWDRSTKMMATLATRLRLAPQSRYDAKTAHRRAVRQPGVRPPWEIGPDE
jgi:hypothetical protein